MNQYEEIVKITEKVESITPKSYLNKAKDYHLIDVRTPGEYQKGHIVGAISLPLFSNEERAIVGTTYNKESKEEAVRVGLELITPKLDSYVKKVASLPSEKSVAIHCWRGGLRSKSFAAYLMEQEIHDVVIIQGGYKSLRSEGRHLIKKIKKPIVLSGYTGTGKTEILQELKSRGEQVLDLEGLANHKGSVFGHIGQMPQPSTEDFLNLIIDDIKDFDFSKRIWLEDEGHSIGSVNLPLELFETIRCADVVFLDVQRSLRSERLVPEYSTYGDEELMKAIEKIRRRLGGQFANQALEQLEKKEYQKVAMICLRYYDNYYWKSISKREKGTVEFIKSNSKSPSTNADLLLEKLKELHG